MYIYKKTNKFPHVVCINADGGDPILKECNTWLTNNIGPYKKSWYCPARQSLNDEWLYAFKSLEDAMAFKLRWI